MNKIKKVIKLILNIPLRIFSKISIFSIVLDSSISKKSSVLRGTRVYNSKIEKYSYIGRNSVVINAKIGSFTSIANNCNIGLASHELSYLSTSPVFYKGKNCLNKNFSNLKHESYKETIIGNDVWIGANVLIKSGIIIGDGAVIGAGSVVTKDVPAYAIYAGNPAKLIRYRFDEKTVDKLLECKWWNINENKLYALNESSNLQDVIENFSKPNILIQSIYAAPYRVGGFEQLSKEYNVDVFFDQLNGHNRNQKFFQNENNLNSYNLEIEEDRKVYKQKIKDIKQYDCVFVYDYSSLSSMKLMIRCMFKKVPYFINCDGYIMPEYKGIMFYIKKIIKTFFIKKATRLLANGESAKNYFLMHGAQTDIIDLHNFSSIYKKDVQKKVVDNKEKLKKELGFNTNRLYISIGSFEHRKGFDLIIKAANHIKDTTSQYVFIGGGDDLDLYKNLCKEYGLNNFTFIKFLEKEELLKFYDAADAFILATREDIWGLVINEAAARGLPIISTDKCNAALEMITKDNGIIAKSDSFKSLGEALNNFNLLSTEDLKLMGEKSLEIASKYTIEGIVIDHDKSIKKVINK